MSNSDRGKFFAIGLVVGLALSILFLLWAVPEFRNPLNQIAQYQTQGGNTAKESQSNYQNEANSLDLRPYISREDTIAQWIMAVFTIFLTVLTFFAVWFVYRTAQFTRDTLTQAEQTNKAAWKTVDETRKIGLAQTRAFIKCVGGEYNFGPSFIEFRVDLENYGVTPATKVEVKAKLRVIEGHHPASGRPTQTFETNVWETIGPIIPAKSIGEVYIGWARGTVDADTFDAIYESKSYFDVTLHVNWSDVLGETQTAVFFLSDSKRPQNRFFNNGIDSSRSGEIEAYYRHTSDVDDT